MLEILASIANLVHPCSKRSKCYRQTRPSPTIPRIRKEQNRIKVQTLSKRGAIFNRTWKVVRAIKRTTVLYKRVLMLCHTLENRTLRVVNLKIWQGPNNSTQPLKAWSNKFKNLLAQEAYFIGQVGTLDPLLYLLFKTIFGAIMFDLSMLTA